MRFSTNLDLCAPADIAKTPKKIAMFVYKWLIWLSGILKS